jgi:hypothetical protein
VFPHHMADLLKQWLSAADHPGMTQVRTCAEIGLWEQPVGVALTLSDGWIFLLQCVGAAPNGGNVNRDPNYPPPDLPAEMWDEMPAYKAARKVFEREQAAHAGPKSRRPQASPQALLREALRVAEAAGHEHIASVEIAEKTGSLKVVCMDGSTVYGLAAGYIAPGASELAHKAHEIPAEWSKEPAHVS